MPVTLSWTDVALRLALACVVGGAIGFDRGEHGRPAGLRTTLLVCLAAAISMIQANLLMNTAGRPPDSFIMLDLMRLPLGILSGMGFIGAGAILRRDNIVLGVTTAATLWFVTVIGLCFGGGQIGLGVSALLLGWLILAGLKQVESWMHQDRRATLILTAVAQGPSDTIIRGKLAEQGYTVRGWAIDYFREPDRRKVRYDVQWRGSIDDCGPPAILDELAHYPGVLRLQWRPADTPSLTSLGAN